MGEVDHKLGCHTHMGADHVASQPVVAQQGHFPFPEVVQIGGEPRGPFTDAIDRLARDEHVADHDHQSLRGRQFGAGIVGRQASTGDNFSHYAYTYTGQGNVASVDNAGTPGVRDVLLTSQFDAAGNRASLAATIAGTADFLNSYSYDTLSQLSMIDQQGQTGGNAVAPKSIYLGYNAIGDVTTIYRANSVNIGPNSQFDPADTALTYNALGLLTGIAQTHAGASLENLSYTYDPLARVSTFTSIDGTASYGYDPTSQLTSASYTTAPGGTQPPNLSLAFDPNGNRTSVNSVTTTVGADNHLASDGTFNFTYDPAGNLSTRVRISTASANDYKTVYLWDYRDRLTDVEFFDNNGVLTQHVHYVYDVWDHLIERDLDPTGGGAYTQIVHYVWDGNNVVLAFNGSQQLTARYLNGPNTSAYDQYFTTLAEEDVNSVTSPGTVTYDLLDPQGSVDDIVDANGNKVDHIVYDPFGQTVLETSTSVSHLGGWQGGYTDPVTGMEKFGARWYILADAIWASQDPLGFLAGDTNLSCEAFDDPANLSDPSGLSAIGHHYVPVSVLNDLRNEGLITPAAYAYAMGRTSGPTSPTHRFGTYGGVKHGDYNKAVGKLARDTANGTPLNKAQMKDLIENKILGGECPKNSPIRKFNNAVANERGAFLAQQRKALPKQLRPKGSAKPPTDAEIMAKGRSIMRQRGLFTALAVAGAMSPVLEALGGEYLDALEAAGQSNNLKELVAALNDGDLARADRAMGDLQNMSGLLGDIQTVTATNAPATTLRDAWQNALRNARSAAYQQLPDGELDDGPQGVPTDSCATPAQTPNTYTGGVLVPGVGALP